MLMNCKRKIHEKLVFENAPQNPEAIKGIRAYLLALLSYATMSKRCENADFDLHIDIEGDETLFETEDESAGEIIRKLGNHGGFTIDITCSGKFVISATVPMRNLSRWRVFLIEFQAFLIALKIRAKRTSSTEK